jgi:hypothetical protein
MRYLCLICADDIDSFGDDAHHKDDDISYKQGSALS